MLTVLDAFLIGGGSIVAFLLLIEGIAHIGGQSFLSSIILGEDNRTSTSKTFILMWTLLVSWALVSMLIVGECMNIHGCASSLATASQVTAAISACGKSNEVTINGRKAVVVPSATPGTVTATVPAGLVPVGGNPVSGTIQVLTAYGAVTPGFTVQLSPESP